METKIAPGSALPDAAHSDPLLMGWMVGSPPPKEKLVRFADGDMLKFPQNRWANSNYRSLVPTKNISRGSGLVAPLPRADRPDLDAVSFVPIGSSENMTWAESLSVNYTDGIVVLHKGHIVYERYMGALDADTPHIAFSVTMELELTRFDGHLIVMKEGVQDAQSKARNAASSAAHVLTLQAGVPPLEQRPQPSVK